MLGMFPSLVSAPDVEIPHERDEINLACLAYQGHTNTCGLMYASIITPPPTPTPQKSPIERSCGIVTVHRCWGMVCYHGSVGCGSQPTQGHGHRWHKNCAHIYHFSRNAPTPCCSSISIDLWIIARSYSERTDPWSMSCWVFQTLHF